MVITTVLLEILDTYRNIDKWVDSVRASRDGHEAEGGDGEAARPEAHNTQRKNTTKQVRTQVRHSSDQATYRTYQFSSFRIQSIKRFQRDAGVASG